VDACRNPEDLLEREIAELLSAVFTDLESVQHNVATPVFCEAGSYTLHFSQVPKNPGLVTGAPRESGSMASRARSAFP
jgi:hypothetical protein